MWWLALLALLDPAAEGSTCEQWGTPALVGRLQLKRVTESSGLAASRLRPGVYFTHEDSGGAPELFSFLADGTPLSVHRVTGARFIDWEAMAAGPCPASVTARSGERACLYIGDIGDNAEARVRVQIYAVAEPGAEDSAAPVLATWHVRYPDGPHNAEALMVHPDTGQITIATKQPEGHVQIFAIPPEQGEVQAQELARLDLSGVPRAGRLITGGEWAPDGSRIVLQSYGPAYEWQVDPCAPLAHWGHLPEKLNTGRKRQGESIAYSLDDALITTSEGRRMPIIALDCLALQASAPAACEQ